ncbi:hypothetical protein PR202_ga10016 [Eleusine coracana subsp. coracana]|uniref:Reverse transcriptase zinc-binding domain-containing protein n=1 Tax=Eleusine coracana subsp. coracana TaxID=191504 RepID=A0AAV5C5L1_ELECO|nr:hypothetical protein PR202_ga10016 [Eleusine coracana subsp. coracana]
MGRCLTADRLARRGLDHPECCPFCDQHDEDFNHILVQCVIAWEVWFNVLRRVGLQHLSPDRHDKLTAWRRRSLQQVQREKRKGLNTLIIFWSLWKHRNRCVFDKAQPSPAFILRDIAEQASLWKMAGAAKLQLLG